MGTPKSSQSTGRTIALIKTIGGTALRAGKEKIAHKMRSATGTSREEKTSGTVPSAAARRLVKGLDELKGAAMKVGQLLSMDRDGDWLPPGWGEVLATLQNNATPWPWESIEKVLNQAWGSQKHLVASLDPQAVSAASMGQVHKGILKDGTPVAVKVRYPGLEHSMSNDLAQLKKAFSLFQFSQSSHKLDEIFQVITQVFHQELDFHFEKNQLLAYASALKTYEAYVLPRPIEPLCTDGVLTMTWLDGQSIHSFLKDTPQLSQEQRNEIGFLALQLLILETFTLNTLQSDPNPGNFFILNPVHSQQIRMGLLDFGATISLEEEFLKNYKKLWHMLLNDDSQGILEISCTMDFIDAKDSWEIKNSFLKMMRIVAEPFTTETYDWTNCGMIKRARQEAMAFVARTHLRPPPADMVFFNRRALGTQMLLEQLRCQIPARKLLMTALQETK